MNPVIRAENLRKTYGSIVAVDDLTFQVERGECIGFLGPNGAGKTTTVRMLYGVVPKTAGYLEVLGLPVPEKVRQVKARIGVCAQEDNLDPDLTVEENLLVYATYFDIPRQKARERTDRLLSFMELDERRKEKVAHLSGGMKRRLTLARSLINDPEILFLDEPTTGLDPQSRHKIWQRIEELKGEGKTILLTTHYMEEAAHLSDRIIIIDRGRKILEGAPQDLVEEEAGRFVIEIVSPPSSLLDFLRERDISWEEVGQRILIYNQSSEKFFTSLMERFPGARAILRMGNLEDVFLRMTGRDLRE
ncbi:MAG: ATP-binding cassette domain-containing protein [Deltaproteobacteria bacterium]|nr:MAG: ATP-binding cassette domain-containing protein [Deltaproteobacteria bacterium]